MNSQICVWFVTFTDYGGSSPLSISSTHRAVVATPPHETFVTAKYGHTGVCGPSDWQQHRVLHWGGPATVDHWEGLQYKAYPLTKTSA